MLEQGRKYLGSDVPLLKAFHGFNSADVETDSRFSRFLFVVVVY